MFESVFLGLAGPGRGVYYGGMNRRRLLRRLYSGAVNNVSFSDFTDLVRGYGFELERISGSHHIFRHPTIPEKLNLQPINGEAKPYQLKNFLRLVSHYDIYLED